MKLLIALFISAQCLLAQTTRFDPVQTSRFVAGRITPFVQTNSTGGGGDITTGLVLHEPLSTSAPDFTLKNSPSFSGGAIQFVAANQTFGYTTPQQWPQSSLTVSVWISMNTPSANYSLPTMYGNTVGGTTTAYFQMFTSSSGVHARMHQFVDSVYIGQQTGSILTSGFHMVTAVWSGGTASTSITIYFDGVLQSTSDDSLGTFMGPYTGSDVPLSIGGQLGTTPNPTTAAACFDGPYKGVYIFNRALSQADINLLLSTGN